MAYIGFFLVMAGLAAAGAAIDKGVSLATSVAMTAAGAALMWLSGDEEEDGMEDHVPASCDGSREDRPAGERTEGSGADQTSGDAARCR